MNAISKVLDGVLLSHVVFVKSNLNTFERRENNESLFETNPNVN